MAETPDTPESLTLVLLRRIATDVEAGRIDIRELRTRIGSVEHGIAQLATGVAELSPRIDRLTNWFERIERRLDLVEEPAPQSPR